MKRSLTAILAFASAAGLAGMVQAQTMTTPTAAPSQSLQGTAPSSPYGSYNQYQSGTAPSYRSAQTTAPQTGMQQPATAQRQANAGDFRPRDLTRDDIKQAQQELRAQGLYRGAIDGIAGPRTKQAIAQFQQENGLQQTATLDQQTVQRLSGEAASSVGASTAPTGATAPLGAGGESYNTQQSLGRTSIQGQPNGYGQPMAH